ncbi:ATP-binding response regulator [Neorhodopirellula pilleata]|uniref:Response regulator FixJ n=1 Tax=Neorhodopirellula pilleata TaxID=2714738 RepID=A0A5C5ZHS6_9BACT|nr:ATP-binding protein [Neorhodopirellula pilleata]TWT86103.1 response regulator FixJ [Neorhodopirellula pilleata]
MSACILIVESDEAVRQKLAALLCDAGYRCLVAENPDQALEMLSSHNVDLMVTEVPRLPATTTDSNGQSILGGSGKSKVDAAPLNRWMEVLRERAPHLPMILLTRPGAERVACEALLRGAASYVPESLIETALVETVGQVIAVGQSSLCATELEQCISRTKLELVLPSQESLVPAVIAKLEQATDQLGLFDEMIWTQVAMALDEAILNAMIHGNLEVDSGLREVDEGQAYWDMIQERRQTAPYSDRRTFITLTATRNQAVFIIRDEGPGFDLSTIPDPDDPANLESIGGRGLLLIGAFMDEVHHNEIGNELTMIKRKASFPSDLE